LADVWLLSSATGLALGIIQAIAVLFWAAGWHHLFHLADALTKARGSRPRSTSATVATSPERERIPPSNRSPQNEIVFAIFSSRRVEATSANSSAPLSRVGTAANPAPTILAAQKAGARRIVVVADPNTRRKVRRALFFTGRLPESVEWIEVAAGTSLSQRLLSLPIRHLVNGWFWLTETQRYHPTLLRKAGESG